MGLRFADEERGVLDFIKRKKKLICILSKGTTVSSVGAQMVLCIKSDRSLKSRCYFIKQ